MPVGLWQEIKCQKYKSKKKCKKNIFICFMCFLSFKYRNKLLRFRLDNVLFYSQCVVSCKFLYE